jgi:hypothetical protein
MLDSRNSCIATLKGAPCRSHRKLIFVGGGRQLWLLNDRMPLIFGVVYGHMKLWMPLLDCQSRLLRRFVRVVSGFQLPIDCNMKRFDERRLAGFS